MPDTDSDNSVEFAPRNKTTATFLTALCPGLGYMYAGNLNAGLAVNGLFFALLGGFAALWTWLAFFPLVPGLVLVAGWVVFTGFVISDVRDQIHSLETFEPRSYNHWTLYSAFALVGYALPLVAIVWLTGVFFWSLAPVDSWSMYPALAPGEVVLVRERGYEGKAVRRGDLVTVRFSGMDDPRILRVVATGGATVRRVGNSLEIDGETVDRVPLRPDTANRIASLRGVPVLDSAAPSVATPGNDGSPSTEGVDAGEPSKTGATDDSGSTTEPPPGNSTFELMVEHNRSTKYIISVRPAVTAKPTFETHRLADDELFLLADNRTDTREDAAGTTIHDSRVFGPVDRSAIFGEPMYVAWSVAPDSGAIRWDRIGLSLQ